jgi:transcription-repair coupling factor (superfamily II helicase)
MYKRIASAANVEELRELQVEMIDRFGLLPEPARNLFAITELKLAVQPLGIRKIEAGPTGGRILFGDQPKIDPLRLIQLVQSRPREFRLEGGDKIRFFRDLADPARRVAQINALVKELVG